MNVVAKRISFAILIVAICALSFVGCNKSGGRAGLVPVQGTLVYNNEPVADAIIEMRPADATMENVVSVGRTDPQGAFTMMTDRPGDGMLPGRYKTAVIKEVEMIGNQTLEEYKKEKNPNDEPEFKYDKSKVVLKSLTPAKYADRENTPLIVEIPKKGDKNLLITIED